MIPDPLVAGGTFGIIYALIRVIERLATRTQVKNGNDYLKSIAGGQSECAIELKEINSQLVKLNAKHMHRSQLCGFDEHAENIRSCLERIDRHTEP